MKRLSTLVASGALLAAVLVFGARLGVGQDRGAAPSQDGITGDFVIVETRGGVLTLLSHPKVRSLGGRTCLVGHSQPIEGGSTDSIFDATEQWIFLDDVRRLGELEQESDLTKVREIMAILRDRSRSQSR